MKGESTYRPDVQALRGFAVLLVVVFHAWPAVLPGGYVGVDVFFVISGYLITGLLLREIDGSGRIDFAAFYARRIRRLLPAAALVTVTTVALAALFYSPLDAWNLAPTAIATALYVSNIWFAVLSVDYLQEGLHQNPLLHTWSLGVEEQFYLVWPALIVAATRLLGHGGTRGRIAWMVVGVSLLSFIACVALTAFLQSWAFFSLPTRAWQLGVGAAAALLERRARVLDLAVQRVMVFGGVLCILVAGLALSGQTKFPGYAALLPVAGAFLVVIGGAADGARGLGAAAFAPLQRAGDLSYSWYLWHWPILIFVADLWPGVDRNLTAAAGVVASLGLARLTYVFVENPIRYHAWLRTRPARSFAVALMLTVGTVGVVLAGRFAATQGHEAEIRRTMELAAKDWPRLYPDKCFASALDSEPPECVYGAADAKRAIALVGDSHAAQWFPAVERLALAHGLKLAVFVKANCPLAAVEPFDGRLNRSYVECTQWREAVFQRLAELQPVLVIGSSSAHYEPLMTRDPRSLDEWRNGLERSLDRLAQTAGHVALISDTPRPSFHVPRCLGRAQLRAGTPKSKCTFFLSESILQEVIEMERAAAGQRAHVTLVDMNDMVCAQVICQVERDGMILFHDAQHISASFARSLADSLWQRLPVGVRAAVSG